MKIIALSLTSATIMSLMMSVETASGDLPRAYANPIGRAINAFCPNDTHTPVTTCVACDHAWEKGLQCNHNEITANLMQTIADGITRTTAPTLAHNVSQEFSHARGCSNTSIYVLDHARGQAYYAFKTTCNCPPTQQLKCTGQITPDDGACRFTSVMYCGFTINGQICDVPKS